MDSAELVERGTILRATVGSTVHGLHHGGQDDRDEMAVFVEPPEYLLGLARARGIQGGLYGFEHFVERHAARRECDPGLVTSTSSRTACGSTSASR